MEAFNGLAKNNPFLAIAAAISLLSLAGIPLTAGFFAKYYIFIAAIQNGYYIWITVIGVIAALIGVYYYFRIIIAMYFKEGDTEKIELSPLFYICYIYYNAIDNNPWYIPRLHHRPALKYRRDNLILGSIQSSVIINGSSMPTK